MGVFKEDNPWRGYEWLYGSTHEPDTMSVDIQGIIPYTSIKSLFGAFSPMDWVSSYKPIRRVINNIIPLIDPLNYHLRPLYNYLCSH